MYDKNLVCLLYSTATDMDFTNLKIAVTFNSNDQINETLSFNLPIVDDDVNEPEELFLLSLKREANPTPGITLQNDMLPCILQDDDGKY